MKKRFLHLAAIAGVLLGGLSILKGIHVLYIRSLPQEKLMRMLEDLTVRHKHQGYLGKEALVLSLSEGSQVVIMGSIKGNGDSFNLIVQGLQKAGILSESLELKPQTYLILNGNALGAVTSNGEILMTIVQLMSRNPQRMWYLRGPEESMDTLASHFRTFFGSRISSPQLKTIQQFMATLPVGIYLFAQDLQENPLRIAPYDVESTVFDRIACTAVDDRGPVRAVCRLNELCYYNEGDLAGIIDSNDESINWTSMKGLEQADSSWHLISGPTLELSKRYGYDISAYALIDMGKSLATSLLTLYYATKGAEEFVPGTRYHIKSMDGVKEKSVAS